MVIVLLSLFSGKQSWYSYFFFFEKQAILDNKKLTFDLRFIHTSKNWLILVQLMVLRCLFFAFFLSFYNPDSKIVI